jgi:polyisoprenoid-binding protein YceI
LRGITKPFFVSTLIKKNYEGEYQITGDLTIKDKVYQINSFETEYSD